ncbi:MAG: YfhO family protein, partial [Candidatus Peregrinibacteria bacterium]|nr:YfhO family protein [Candidatus Peregrinibacteria bacterium]
SGLIPGKDFFYFHGLGTLMINVPIFSILGKTLQAEEVSKYVMSFFLPFIASLCLLLSLRIKPVLVLLFSMLLIPLSAKLGYTALYHPGNSLIGVRTFFTLLFVAGILHVLPKIEEKRRHQVYSILGGFGVAGTLFFSVEKGIGALIGFLLVSVLFQQPWKEYFKNLTIFLGTFFVSTFLVFWIFAGSYFWENITYALIDIPKDQFWYFGGYPNEFFYTIKQLFGRVGKKTLWALFYAFLLAFMVIRLHRKKKDIYLRNLLLFLIFWGLFSLIALCGMFIDTYLIPLIAVEVLIAFYLGIKILKKHYKDAEEILVLVLFVLMMLTTNFQSLKTSIIWAFKYDMHTSDVRLSNAWINHLLVWDKILGKEKIVSSTSKFSNNDFKNGIFRKSPNIFLISSDNPLVKVAEGDTLIFNQAGPVKVLKKNIRHDYWMEIITDTILDSKRDGYPHKIVREGVVNNFKRGDIWSTYGGLIEYNYDILPASTFDYIIHALGDEKRIEYVNEFIKTNPTFVTTISGGLSFYENWLQNQSWKFYETLLNRYDMVGISNYKVFWKRKDNLLDTIKSEVVFDKNIVTEDSSNESIMINFPTNGKTTGIYVAELEYEVKNSWSWLPVLNKLPRYEVVLSNTDSVLPIIGLPPHKNKYTFPIFPSKNDKDIQIIFNTRYLLPGAKLNPKKIVIRHLDIDQQTVKHLNAKMDKNSPLSIMTPGRS